MTLWGYIAFSVVLCLIIALALYRKSSQGDRDVHRKMKLVQSELSDICEEYYHDELKIHALGFRYLKRVSEVKEERPGGINVSTSFETSTVWIQNPTFKTVISLQKNPSSKELEQSFDGTIQSFRVQFYDEHGIIQDSDISPSSIKFLNATDNHMTASGFFFPEDLQIDVAMKENESTDTRKPFPVCASATFPAGNNVPAFASVSISEGWQIQTICLKNI